MIHPKYISNHLLGLFDILLSHFHCNEAELSGPKRISDGLLWTFSMDKVQRTKRGKALDFNTLLSMILTSVSKRFSKISSYKGIS